MVRLFKRYIARRRLRPIVSILPRRLAKAFGTREHYTFLQAKRVVSGLRLPKEAELYAFAAACSLQEFVKSSLSASVRDYERLRIELADQFYLRGPDFNVKYL